MHCTEVQHTLDEYVKDADASWSSGYVVGVISGLITGNSPARAKRSVAPYSARYEQPICEYSGGPATCATVRC